MLLIDRLLMEYGKRSWLWIVGIVALRLFILVGITQFSLLLGKVLATMTVSTIGFVIGLCLSISLFILLVSLVQGELEYQLQARTRTMMRNEMVKKTLELDSGQLEEIGPTSSSIAALDAVEMALPYVSVYLPSLVYSFVAPLYLFFEVRKYQIGIASILLAVSWLLLPIHNLFRKNIERLRKKYWLSLEMMTRLYLDGLRGMTTLKIYNQSKAHVKKLEQYSQELNRDIHAFMKINFSSFLVTEWIMYGTLFLVVLWGIQSQLSLANNLSLLLLGYAYFASIRQLMSATHDALTAISASTKMQSILQKKTARVYEFIPANQEEGIQFENVSFSYEGRNEVIQDLNLDIKKGEVLALVGLSGCGKSTIASLALRFIDPKKGHIRLDGQDYRSLSEEILRKKLVMVPQRVHIFSGTIRSNLMLGKETASDEELFAVLKKVRLEDFVKTLPHQLDEEVGENGSRLSGGQKQKLGMARALLSDAPYMVLDEATSAVDPKNEEEIWRIIHTLFHEKTLLLISHRLSTIQQADRIVVMEEGKIVEEGTHDQLMANAGLYAQMVDQQEALEGGFGD